MRLSLVELLSLGRPEPRPARVKPETLLRYAARVRLLLQLQAEQRKKRSLLTNLSA